MNKIRCIAVDDEPLALELLVDNIRQVPLLELVQSCKNAFEAQEILQTQQVDLIFLDIQMPGITGVQFLRSLPVQPLVIFITAYKKFALEGFELDVIDYLVKPVPIERFVKAVYKASEYHQLRNSTFSREEKEHIFVHSEYTLTKVELGNITHIEGLKDYVKIHQVKRARPVVTRLSLKAMEDTLPPHRFARIHKSYIIAVDKVRTIRNNLIQLDEVEVPMSERYREALFKLIDRKGIRF